MDDLGEQHVSEAAVTGFDRRQEELNGPDVQEAAEPHGPGLAVALGLLLVGALAASVWWIVVLLFVLSRLG